MSPKISIIVPIYNVEKYLPRCIESLLAQTLDDYEIILVNDGSPDNSKNIIADYASRYPEKIVALEKVNGGLSDARNYGIPYAKGEYIGFLDSDDYVDASYLEKMYNKAKSTDADIVVCGYYGVDEINNTFKLLQMGNEAYFGMAVKDNKEALHINAPYAWNKIYRRSFFMESGILYPKGWIWEDIPTTYPLLALANKVEKVNEPLVYYVLKREGAITATYSRKQLQLFRSLDLLIQRYKDLGLFEEYYDEILFLNMRHTIFRFREFKSYKDQQLKKDFVNQGFAHLDKNFPDWKTNPHFHTVYYKNSKLQQKLIKSKAFWMMMAMMPSFMTALAEKFNKLLKVFKKMVGITARCTYTYTWHFKHSPIDENAVLFESFHGTTLSDSPFYMLLDLVKKDPSKKIYCTSEDFEKHQALIKHYGLNVELLNVKSTKYAKVLATAKYLVNNVSFPPYFMRREEQKYINTWHGTPLKTLGKKMSQGIEDMTNMQKNFLHATDLLHPNDYTKDHMMEDYNLNDLYTGKVIVSGYPRNSIFSDEKKAKEVRKQFNLEDKEVFAYMPTWRGTQSTFANSGGYEEDVRKILDALDEGLSDQQILYVNLHSLVKDKVTLAEYKHIFPFPNIDNYEFLNCVDCLISDYSSVFFDYSITKKDVVLFMYDYEEYMRDRGMYMSVEDLPFKKLYNIEEMIRYFKDPAFRVVDKSAMDQYYKTFTPYDTIDSASIINDYFFFGKEDGLKIEDYSYNKEVEHTLIIPDAIHLRSELKDLEIFNEYEKPIALFVRAQFNFLLRGELSSKYDKNLPYISVTKSTPLTFLEQIGLRAKRFLKFIKVDDAELRPLQNYLPNIKITKIVCGKKQNKYLVRLTNEFNKVKAK